MMALLAVVLVLGVSAAVAIPLAVTSSPDFFARYHLLNRRYVNLESSAHEGIGCRSCHETDPVTNGTQLVAEFYSGLFTRGEMPTYFTFEPPANEACLRCHESDWAHDAKQIESIPHPAHTRVSTETRQCVRCHKWTAHLETFMPKHKTMPFSGVCVSYGCHVGTKDKDQCFNCHHVLRQTAVTWKKKHPDVVSQVGQAGCLESCHEVGQCRMCHTTGKMPKITGLPIRTGLDAIEQGHVGDDWVTDGHGPAALRDRDTCLLCHQSQGECQECHRYRPAFHGKPTAWIGRHSKVTKKVDDPRCLECHKKPWCEECHQQFKEME